MLREKLIKNIKKYNLEMKSIEAFWFAFNNYKEEDKEEFQNEFPNYNRAALKIEVRTISFKLGNWPYCDYNHIVVDLNVNYEGNDKGDYLVYFSLDGEIEDDFFLVEL